MNKQVHKFLISQVYQVLFQFYPLNYMVYTGRAQKNLGFTFGCIGISILTSSKVPNLSEKTLSYSEIILFKDSLLELHFSVTT